MVEDGGEHGITLQRARGHIINAELDRLSFSFCVAFELCCHGVHD